MKLSMREKNVMFWAKLECTVRQLMEDNVIKICNTLEHTPVSAVGVNIQYEVKDPNSQILEYFNSKDVNIFSDNKYTLKSSLIKRTLQKKPHINPGGRNSRFRSC